MGRIVALLMLSALLLTGTASGRTWTVLADSTGDAPTIQAGIDSASAGDTVMVGCGTYHEHAIDIPSELYLTSETGCADCVTIDAEGLGKGFHAYCESLTYIVGFTVTGGVVFDERGAGLSDYYSALQVINCTFHNNVAYHSGGGAQLFFSASVFNNCVFSGNWAYGWCPESTCPHDGGGVYCAW